MTRRLPALYGSLIASFSFLPLPSCFSQGPGSASLSLPDLGKAHENPSALGWIRQVCAGTFYLDRFRMKELSVKAGMAAVPVKGGTLGLSFSSHGYSLFRRSQARLAFGKSLGNKISAGISLGHYSIRIPDYGKTRAFAGEAGIQARPVKHLTLGIHLFNPTRAKLRSEPDEPLPTSMRIGFDYRFSEKVSVYMETEKQIALRAGIKAGLEYHPATELFIRCGAATNPPQSCFGIGTRLKNITAEINSSYHSALGFISRIGIAYTSKNIRKN